MTDFNARPLGVLDRLYNFVGGLRGVRSLDLASPIVLVHDVAREAELGTWDGLFGGLVSGISPFFTINIAHVHLAATNETSVIGLYSNQAPTWALSTWVPPDPEKETCWCIGCSAMSQAGLIASAAFTHLAHPKASAGSGFDPEMVLTFLGADASAAMNSGLFPLVRGDWSLPSLANPIVMSNKLLNATPLSFRSTSTAAETVDFFLQMLRLPNGVFPPGLR